MKPRTRHLIPLSLLYWALRSIFELSFDFAPNMPRRSRSWCSAGPSDLRAQEGSQRERELRFSPRSRAAILNTTVPPHRRNGRVAAMEEPLASSLAQTGTELGGGQGRESLFPSLTGTDYFFEQCLGCGSSMRNPSAGVLEDTTNATYTTASLSVLLRTRPGLLSSSTNPSPAR